MSGETPNEPDVEAAGADVRQPQPQGEGEATDEARRGDAPEGAQPRVVPPPPKSQSYPPTPKAAPKASSPEMPEGGAGIHNPAGDRASVDPPTEVPLTERWGDRTSGVRPPKEKPDLTHVFSRMREQHQARRAQAQPPTKTRLAQQDRDFLDALKAQWEDRNPATHQPGEESTESEARERTRQDVPLQAALDEARSLCRKSFYEIAQKLASSLANRYTPDDPAMANVVAGLIYTDAVITENQNSGILGDVTLTDRREGKGTTPHVSRSNERRGEDFPAWNKGNGGKGSHGGQTNAGPWPAVSRV